MRQISGFGLALAWMIAAPAFAQDLPSPLDLQAGLVGEWTGALGYRDYQSNKLFELPVKTEVQALPDKATVIRVSSVDDGTDNDKPALLRTTETHDGDTVTAVKEVMPKDQPAKGWQFRNQTRLSRVTG